jgi:pimeloyl-ACP methyl ester carboxylesterase
MKLDLPTIIILHGWGLSAKRFAPLVSVFKKRGYRVLAPDFPGFGESSMPTKPYSLSDYVVFLEDYLTKNKVGRFVLIGHSFGGRVSLKFCLKPRPYLAGLILTGTPGVTPVAKRKLFLFIALAKIGKFFFSIWPLSRMQEKIRLWYYYLVGAREFYRADGVMRETFKRIVQEELVSYMKHVTVPTLLVWGQMDQITPVWIAQKMHEEIKNSKLIIIPERDHGVPFKDPELFVLRVEKFLKGL